MMKIMHDSMDMKESEELSEGWEMFGKPMMPDLRQVTAEQMVMAIREESVEPHMCNNPVARQIGFVWYHPDKGVAVTRRVPLTQILNDEAKVVIEGLWTKLRAEA